MTFGRVALQRECWAPTQQPSFKHPLGGGMKALDLTGQSFGRLTIIQKSVRPSNGVKWASVKWMCRCSCGQIAHVDAGKLRNGHTRSCGCIRREGNYGPPIKDRTGVRYGRWTALERIGRDTYGKDSVWRCRCDCGN